MPDGFVPGSGGNNAGYAVVYGDDRGEKLQFANLLQQQNLAQQQRLEQQQQADAAHKFALQKYYGAQFDPSKFDTKTDLNRSVNDALIAGKKSFSEVLNKKGATDEDIDNAAQEALGPAMQLYQAGTTVKRNIDQQTEAYKSDKGIDVGSLQKQAYLNALYTKGSDGKMRLKNSEELAQIDPEHNYAQDLLTNHPELLSKGDLDIDGALKTMVPSKQSLTGAWYSSPGVKRKSSYDASWYDAFQNFGPDAKGVNQVTTKNNPITVTDANGKQHQIDQIPDDVLSHFQQTAGQKAALDVATLKYLAKNSPGVPVQPGSQAFVTAKKKMLYDVLNERAARSISEKKDVTMAAPVIRMQLGLPVGGAKAAGSGNQQAETQASFNDVTDTPFVGDNGVKGTISNGVLEPNTKSFGGISAVPYSGGEVIGSIPEDKLPLSVRDAVVKYSQGNNVTGEKDKYGTKTGLVKVKINNGQVVGVKTDAGQWFDVGSRTNADIVQKNKQIPIKQKEQIKLPSDGNKGSSILKGNVR